MRQAIFEARHAADWAAFEAWLDRDERLRRPGARAQAAPPEAGALADAAVPETYRRVCQHLALARDRQYSPDLVDRLNRLALRGHHLLYGARAGRGRRAAEFLLGGFPRLVREEGALVAASAALFFGPLVTLLAVLQWFPDFVYYLLAPESLAQFQEMYDPANRSLGRRDADDNAMMFGFYIWNNVKIGFQTFATGLAFGLGSIFYLVSNGVLIGAIAGYLTQVGYAETFWSFVSGHSAMELVAIVISGAAGLRLGAALVAPGSRTRKAALVEAAKPAVRLMYGAAGMFVVAAFIEAFWSPVTAFPAATKYAVGLALWVVVIGYLALGGRARAA
jgi:uncharacterized membrane protein SpoIIM required for sporulation